MKDKNMSRREYLSVVLSLGILSPGCTSDTDDFANLRSKSLNTERITCGNGGNAAQVVTQEGGNIVLTGMIQGTTSCSRLVDSILSGADESQRGIVEINIRSTPGNGTKCEDCESLIRYRAEYEFTTDLRGLEVVHHPANGEPKTVLRKTTAKSDLSA